MGLERFFSEVGDEVAVASFDKTSFASVVVDGGGEGTYDAKEDAPVAGGELGAEVGEACGEVGLVGFGLRGELEVWGREWGSVPIAWKAGLTAGLVGSLGASLGASGVGVDMADDVVVDVRRCRSGGEVRSESLVMVVVTTFRLQVMKCQDISEEL